MAAKKIDYSSPPCPKCGMRLENYFDHVTIDCNKLSTQELHRRMTMATAKKKKIAAKVKTSVRNTPAQNRAVKKATPAKKVVTAKRATGNTPVAPAVKPAAAKKPRVTRKPKITPQPEWRINFVFGNSTGVFGLASDQRIYRWNTRSALWVLHKEGLSATQA